MYTISVARTRKSREIKRDIFRDSTNTQLPFKHFYIVNDTNTVCNENIYHVDTNKIRHAHDHLSNEDFPSLNLIIFFATQV